MPIADAGFFVHHFGWYLIEAEQAQRKFALYRELLAAKLQQRPEDPQVLMQYGDALCNHDGRPEEGLACFMKAAQLHPEYTEIWAHIAPALLRLGHLEAALIAIGQIPSTSASAGRRSQLRGEVFAAMGRWAEAAEAYATALQHYPGYVGLTAKLGLVQTVAGDTKAGEDHLQTAIASAERAAERAPGALSFQRAAELHAQLRRWPDVLRLTRAGLAYAPTAAALHELTLRAAVAQGELGLAAAAAASLASHASAPRASLRYAAILRQMGAHQAAAAAVREGLARFPDEPSLLRAQQELAQEPNPIAIQMPDPKPHQMPGPADGHIGAAS
jgi:tetratricopeptide (TPR) repeat protein